jgi:hypothetical protein
MVCKFIQNDENNKNILSIQGFATNALNIPVIASKVKQIIKIKLFLYDYHHLGRFNFK